jgi:drug/metabolite transporter (DMT)-like permease
VAILVAMGCAWGTTQPLGKLATTTGYQPFGLIFWQLVIGALVLWPLAVLTGPVRVGARALGWAALIAMIGTVIPNYTFYLSVERLPAGIMSIIICTVPMMSYPMAIALGMDRLQAGRLLGLACGLTGVALIALPGSSLPDPAMAAFLPVAMVGPLFYAIEGNVVARIGTLGMPAVQAMALASSVGAVIAAPLALGTGQWVTPQAAWGVAEWALVGSSVAHAMAYAAYVWLAARAGAVFASQCSYIVTGTGVMWAALLLGERFGPWVWAALAVMLAGLALVQPRDRPQRGV